jgi:tetraacyldisaccharide 4'-kinase
LNDAFHALIRGDRTGLWPSLQRAGLWSLGLGYRLGVACRNVAFDRGWKTIHKATVPVVSVGNLTTGGTGKTPCVEYIARFYRQLDLRVTLLSRGYGSESGRNDEALVLEENLPDVPHLQGADRVELAKIAVEELECDILVLDDGFQHRRLHRNLDIVLIDATCPWGYGHLLPRGLLREPIGGLKRADIVILTRCDLVPADAVKAIRETVERIKPGLPVAESVHRAKPQAAWLGPPIAAFCGIGNPEAFRQTLASLGMNVIVLRIFPDHHAYGRDDIEALRNWARELPAETAIVTTQKDMVKIRLTEIGNKPLSALPIQLQVTSGQEALEGLLRKTVRV